MKRLLPAWSLLVVAGVTFVWLMATPVPAAAQGVVSSSGASGGGGGGSVSSGGSSGGSVSSGSGGSSGGGGGGSVSSGDGSSGGHASAPGRSGATGGSGYSAPRNGGSRSSGGNATGRATGRSRDGSGKPGDGDSGTPPGGARDRGGREPVGNAVPRGSVPPNRGGGPAVFIPGGYYGGYYDPWWYGPGYSGYYGGFYDPWYGGYPTSTSGQYSSTYQEEGKLRLKIKPREAEVYVDGYFVGIIDDFDGVFQRLHIETGSHRIEVRAPGYEPLVIDVRISPEHTTTYQGELKRIQ